MKLYYATATCSLAPHIALKEAGLDFTAMRYDMKTERLEDGRALGEINDKGYVPVLELDDGSRLTEVAVILQFIADRVPEKKLAPAFGTFERYRLQEWLNFVATEIHKPYWPLFHDGAEIEKEHAKIRLAKAFDWTQEKLGDGPYLMGDAFTVADAYLVVTLNWTRAAGIELERWPRLAEYRKRLRERPAVAAALEAEGLLRRKASA